MGQTAATLSDEYAEVPPSPGEYTKEALSSLDKRVSRGVAKVLASAGRSIEQDVAMQIALQACMSLRLNLAIQRWSFGSLADDGALKDVSKTISENEPEQVARKWRSLTHQYARWTRQDRSKAQKTIVNHIKEHLADVLVAAGHASDHMMSLAAVHARVGAHVSNVVRLAFELNEVLGQGLGAYDMSPAHFSYGTTFDPETMQDGYPTTMPEDIDGRRGKVLCTTDLGLVRVMKGREDVLVKPKVALDALISPGY
ncbi:hypothetical protein OF83DRAFT_1063485 [Amylostereum chailletii]|nr:hypothetical protein OF83DRAFT_1063485 [Amylostereum chailletii]